MKASKRIENIGCGELSRKLPTMRYQFIQFIKSAFLHLHRFCPICAIFQFVQIIFSGKRRQKKAIWCLRRRRYFIRKSPSRHHKWSGELLCWNRTLFLEFLNFSFLLQGSLKIIQTKMFSLPHLILTGLHMLQMTLAYFLMLIVMTYNSWLCGAVILGSTLGYFCFGWRKTSIVDVSDHCHWRLFQGKIWKSQKYSFKVKIV